jgi:hypothetical protein
LGQQPVDIPDRYHLRQGTAAARALQHGGRVVDAPALGVEKTVELAHGRQAPRHRGGREGAVAQRRHVAAQVVRCRLRQAALPDLEMGGEVLEVPAVGVERVLAGAALGSQHVEKQLD